MADRRQFQASPYNTPHQPLQRFSSRDSIGSQHSQHSVQSQHSQHSQHSRHSYHSGEQQYMHPMQPLSNEHPQQMPLHQDMNNLHLSHSQQSFGSDSSFEVSFDDPGFPYTVDESGFQPHMTPLTGAPNVMWGSQPDLSQQNQDFHSNNYYPNYATNQNPIQQGDQNQAYYHAEPWLEDPNLESTLTHSTNNTQAPVNQPQAPVVNHSIPASQEYYPDQYNPPSNYSEGHSVDYESDTSELSVRRGRTSRSSSRPYDRPPQSRSTSRNSVYDEVSSSSQVQPAGRGRPALYKIDLDNLNESQTKCMDKIMTSAAYLNKPTDEAKREYLKDRLMNNEAVKTSRANKNNMMRDVLDFGEQLYNAAQNVRLGNAGFKNEIETLLAKIETWEIDNDTPFLKKIKDLKPNTT